MKERYIIAPILTMLITFSIYTACRVNDILTTLDTVSEMQDTILDELSTLNDKLHSETQKEQIEGLEMKFTEYAEKVNNMTMDYMTLDEILKQMFGEAQASYFREGRGK